MKLAFLGLGVMGFPMAGHLARAGHDVTVYNRSAAKAAQWVATHGGRSAATPAAAAKDAQIVMMCVGNDDDVRAVANGADGALAGMAAGAIARRSHDRIGGSRARSLRRREIARRRASSTRRCRAARRVPKTASSRSWSAATRRRSPARRSVLATYARAVTLMGGAGAGQLTKMVNQICIAGLVRRCPKAFTSRCARGSTRCSCST